MSILYVVATPIGNLEDISFRALRVIKEVDLILCEDTRVTKRLLAKYQIATKTISYHQHSRLKKIEYILEQLKQGKKLALVSDAGTPAVSDPGAMLVSYLREQLPQLEIVSIPGPSALTAALSIAGVPADKFIFLGFPPVKKKRKKFFQEVADAKYTVVFYESPHRIIKTLEELSVVAGKKKIVVCKELTKKFEKCYSGNINEVLEQLKKDKIRGEFVVII